MTVPKKGMAQIIDGYYELALVSKDKGYFDEAKKWIERGLKVIGNIVGQKKPNPWGLYDMRGNYNKFNTYAVLINLFFIFYLTSHALAGAIQASTTTLLRGSYITEASPSSYFITIKNFNDCFLINTKAQQLSASSPSAKTSISSAVVAGR